VVDGAPLEPGAVVELAPGDLFAVLSDGIFEAKNPDREVFGEERVVDLLRRRCAESPGAILEALRAEVVAFRGGAAQRDDQTAILVKRRA
jgi:sigma-B regulation protein RsbU (phosphoserine phosphatase)